MEKYKIKKIEGKQMLNLTARKSYSHEIPDNFYRPLNLILLNLRVFLCHKNQMDLAIVKI